MRAGGCNLDALHQSAHPVVTVRDVFENRRSVLVDPGRLPPDAAQRAHSRQGAQRLARRKAQVEAPSDESVVVLSDQDVRVFFFGGGRRRRRGSRAATHRFHRPRRRRVTEWDEHGRARSPARAPSRIEHLFRRAARQRASQGGLCEPVTRARRRAERARHIAHRGGRRVAGARQDSAGAHGSHGATHLCAGAGHRRGKEANLCAGREWERQ
mmetsp:Transcript_8180/g.27164  ORF Transcript_8180/g.27164 Transcript_8180/m.27164 type:complete len:212 (+) Transcript_8180:1167-1802(+)